MILDRVHGVCYFMYCAVNLYGVRCCDNGDSDNHTAMMQQPAPRGSSTMKNTAISRFKLAPSRKNVFFQDYFSGPRFVWRGLQSHGGGRALLPDAVWSKSGISETSETRPNVLTTTTRIDPAALSDVLRTRY